MTMRLTLMPWRRSEVPVRNGSETRDLSEASGTKKKWAGICASIICFRRLGETEEITI